MNNPKSITLINESGIINYNCLLDEKYDLGVRLQDKNEDFPKHFHNYIEIVCQINGSSTQIINGIKHELHPYEIIIIHPQQSHQNILCNSDVLNLIISEKFLNNLILESAFDEDIIDLKQAIMLNLYATKYFLNAELIFIIDKLFNNYTGETPMYYIKQKLLITQFLLELKSTIKIEKHQYISGKLDLISYIQNNLCTASLTEFAKMNNCSTSLLSKKIKEEYNMTFIEILHEIKIKEAVTKLISTDQKIDKIMYDIGYNNKTHFYALFKEKFNTTPKEYKKSHTFRKYDFKNDTF